MKIISRPARSSTIAIATLAFAASLTAFPIAAAPAQEELPGGGTFLDDDDMREEGFIEAIAARGVTKGCNPPANDLFCPREPVTRAQMATFLVRALGLGPGDPGDRFTDDDDSVHEGDIETLAGAGVTRGCNPPDNDRFCPDRIVSRGEMAAFLARAFDYPPPEIGDLFGDDDESIFESEIDSIAAAGLTAGCGVAAYCPNEPMLRSHMAVFLTRALGLVPTPPPPRPRVISTFTTRHKCCQSRVTNIHLIADTVDGAVVLPGASWSLNGHVGKRTVEKGYRAAGAIVGGELVCCDHPDNIGGGTSQFATTLYNAVFFAGLEILAHKPHSIYFPRYPLGHEATLGWTWPDVVFRNDTPYPLTIETSHTSTAVTVTVVGFNENRRVDTEVTGSATTSLGGAATVTRTVTYEDGSQSIRTWTHTYRPLPPDEDEGEEGGGGGDDGGSGGGGGGHVPQ
ncbi:MAG: VanW family protein [Acidimicrobiia bacterium]